MKSLVIGLSGKQGAGKTTIADLLSQNLKEEQFEVKVFKFAKPLYQMHDAVWTVAKQYGMANEHVKDGVLLQLLGTEWGRKTRGENIWVNCLLHELSLEDSKVESKSVFIIDDMRFPNEFDGLHNLNAVTIRLDAPAEVRRPRAEMWRENEQHPSETGLDNYYFEGKFDLVLDTARNDKYTNTAKVLEFLKKNRL